MISLCLSIFAIALAYLDNYKYIWQVKKMKNYKFPRSVSKRFLLVSVLTRVFLMIYSAHQKYWVFFIIYGIGLFTTGYAYWELYKKYRFSGWTFWKFLKRSL